MVFGGSAPDENRLKEWLQMLTAAAKVLFVVKSANDLTEGEREIDTRLGPGGLGYTVETMDETKAVALSVRDKALVVISSNVDAARVRHFPLPAWKSSLPSSSC